MTVTETMPPEPNMLKFLLERRMPDKYREIKEVQHTHNAGALFQAFLKRMDDAKRAEPLLIKADPTPAEAERDKAVERIIEGDYAGVVSPVLAQNPEPLGNQGLAPDRSSET